MNIGAPNFRTCFWESFIRSGQNVLILVFHFCFAWVVTSNRLDFDTILLIPITLTKCDIIHRFKVALVTSFRWFLSYTVGKWCDLILKQICEDDTCSAVAVKVQPIYHKVKDLTD